MLSRLYAALGFHECKAPAPLWQGVVCREYGGSNMVFDLSWRDRLRVLISGKLMVDMTHAMDKPPLWFQSEGVISVLPPRYGRVVMVTCLDCYGDGSVEVSKPQRDDPHFAVTEKCENCNGSGWVPDNG